MSDSSNANGRQASRSGGTRACRIEIPLPTVDNAGRAFAEKDIRWFEAALRKIGSGYRKYRQVAGEWESDGVLYEEPVTVYVVTIAHERLAELVALLDRARAAFRQEAILAEVTRVDKVLLDGNGGLSDDAIRWPESALPS